jgi:hypothetical protein
MHKISPALNGFCIYWIVGVYFETETLKILLKKIGPKLPALTVLKPIVNLWGSVICYEPFQKYRDL